MNIYFLKYNNYFNRTFRRENSLIDYLAYEVGRTVDVKLFTPGDGVNTSVVVNVDLKAAGMSPDYAIVQDDQGNIESRWFVMECRQLRVNQFKVDLRRDLVVESIDSLETCDRFWCDRGLVEDSNNLILQPESISVNRIKKSETLIKDNTGVAWLVGYIAQGADATLKKISGLTSYDRPNYTVNTLQDAPYWENTSYNTHEATPFKGKPYNFDVEFDFTWSKKEADYLVERTRFQVLTTEKVFSTKLSNVSALEGYWKSSSTAAIPTINEVKEAFKNSAAWYEEIINPYNFHTQPEINQFVNMAGQTVLDKSTSKIYKYVLKQSRTVDKKTFNGNEVKITFPIVNGIIYNKLGAYSAATPAGNDIFHTSAAYFNYTLELEEVIDTSVWSYEISGTRKHTLDAPYDLICIPYGEFNGVGSQAAAMDIAVQTISQNTTSTGGSIYDFQLLPYCPLTNWNIGDLTENIDYTKVKDKDGNIVAYVYYCERSTFSKTILLDTPIGVENPKLNSIIDLYRLVSPNYSGQFEFTAAANGGISGVVVNATYLPLSPYIRIAPVFGRLYGEEFKDARGLICGGDFSLPVVTSAWISYQQNNKTYQAVFDRSIANLEFTNNIGRKMDRIGAFVGTIQGAAQGGAAGSVGGPWGAVAGAVVGSAGSLGGGIADINLNEQMRQEQLSYIKDQQRLNLAAIQAQPYSLSKTTAFTANNKIFPILEFYTCSEKEKEAVVAYLVNNSFNIGAVIPFKSILITSWAANNKTARKWIQGHPIEIDIGEDYHYTAELGRELAQGYYFEYWEEN